MLVHCADFMSFHVLNRNREKKEQINRLFMNCVHNTTEIILCVSLFVSFSLFIFLERD